MNASDDISSKENTEVRSHILNTNDKDNGNGNATTTRNNISSNKHKPRQLQQILDNLADVETALQSVLQTHRHGNYGFVTREWGEYSTL